jgi:hypothetical protein
VLERLIPNFRELLKQFAGSSCPMCAVLKRREQEEIERVRSSSASTRVLCGPHLEMALFAVASPMARVRVTRSAIESVLADRSDCDVCSRLSQIELRLARAIRRLDGGMRFRKALESAPLFCRKHAGIVAKQDVAVNFAQVQRAKLLHLRDALAQAELRNGAEMESLILTALTYLAAPLQQEPPPVEVHDSSDCTENEAAEFERWEEARQFKHLADLESEAAGLRYRNAVLSEENRRLKLAHVAGEAIRRDLEHDRAQLLAAAKEQDAKPLKFSSRH